MRRKGVKGFTALFMTNPQTGPRPAPDPTKYPIISTDKRENPVKADRCEEQATPPYNPSRKEINNYSYGENK